jgi:amidophosphoribosyltransferase
MTDELKHECAVAMVVLRKSAVATGDFGGTKLSLLLEKQHNRGQDGAGAAILSANPEPGEAPYWIAKSASATPLTDVLGMIGKRSCVQTGLTGLTRLSGDMSPDPKNPVNLVNPVKTRFEKIFLGHLRYATFGKNDVAFCHPFVHESSELNHTLLLAGNFNLTNAHELFDDYRHHGSFPTSKSDGYLITSLIAKQLEERSAKSENHISKAISAALANADGAWTLCGMTADGWAFATRDPHGIRPGWHYIDEDVVVVASERAAIQAAFDVPPEAVKELPPGEALVVSPEGKVGFCELDNRPAAGDSVTTKLPNHQTTKPIPRPCSFERIYFSRANDADIHRERKALGAALLPRILEAANAPMDRIFFSYIPNSARIAFHGLLEALFVECLTQSSQSPQSEKLEATSRSLRTSRATFIPRFGEVAVKDAKFRTFIADAAARREFYKHVYDVTYGLVKKDDTLVVLDDSIVRGNTMKNAILPMLDRLGPKRIVIASSAPPIRYPDCYGIDMSTLGELVAFRALVNLLGADAEKEFRNALADAESSLTGLTGLTRLSGDTSPDPKNPVNLVNPVKNNPLEGLYARFTEEQHTAEIARLLTPPGMKAEVVVVYQTVENLRQCLSQPPNHSTTKLPNHSIGDWYFTGDYPTPGGYKVLRKALLNYLEKSSERSY